MRFIASNAIIFNFFCNFDIFLKNILPMLLKVQPGYTLSNLCLLIYPIALNCTLCCTFATALLAKFRFAIYLQCNTVFKCNLCEYLLDASLLRQTTCAVLFLHKLKLLQCVFRNDFTQTNINCYCLSVACVYLSDCL